MGEAFEIARREMDEELKRIRGLRDKLLDGVRHMKAVYVNGDMDKRIPNNLNISFAYVEGESLMMAIKELAVSSGSACTSASFEPSYVLRSLGLSDEMAHSSLRITLGRFTTESEIDCAIRVLNEKVTRLRDISPLWEMYQAGVDISQVEWAAR
jgi:cysteine desulfurase